MSYYPSSGGSQDDPANNTASNRQQVIDGTPARVAALGLVAIAVLIGLRWSGFRFNVTAGN
jgi:hypothetical protein